ncbi:MAG: UPF0182 family protein, partial [Cyanobacteria bacterium P01_F01_bin.42]
MMPGYGDRIKLSMVNLSQQVQALLLPESKSRLAPRLFVGLTIGTAVLGLMWIMSLGIVEALWFREVGYASLFWIQRGSQILLWLLGFSVTVLVMGSNFYLARKLVRSRPVAVPLPPQTPTTPGYLSLLRLLSSLLSLTFSMGVIITHYLYECWNLWSAHSSNQTHSLAQLSTKTLASVLGLWQQFPVLGLIVPCGFVLLFLAPATMLTLIALTLGLEFGFILAHQWAVLLASFQVSEFGQVDPLFHRDIGFYVFQLPRWELAQFMFLGISLVTFLGVTFFYLVSGKSVRKGRFPRLSREMLKHLYGIAAVLMVSLGLGWGLHCFTLLYSSTGALYGASFTDRYVHLPVRIVLGLGAIALAVVCTYRAIHLTGLRRRIPLEKLLGGYIIIAIFLGAVVPSLVQNLLVTPNELTREEPYIKESIEATRRAFGLDTIQTETFTPSGTLTPELLEKNDRTIRNIRLWDSSPLLKANRQLQRIRPYYEFADADIDRYPVNPASGESAKRQVLIAARELDFADVPKAAKTWINKRLIYTHGYGFTVSPVNTAAASGLPEYFVQDIETEEDRQNSDLSSLVQSIPTRNPRIYFGELTDHYIFTNTKEKELDYPRGNENALTTYSGAGGIPIDSVWKRMVFSLALRDWQLLLSPNLIADSKVLMNRLIQDRVRIVAPFIKFDQDPYLVSAAVKSPNSARQESVLYWIIDAYTLSDRYPYSDPGELSFNYIRNSIKVVVDAYNGSV